MKLLDAAEVQTKSSGGWERGWNGDPRGCGGFSLYIADPCDPAVSTDVIGTEADANDADACAYFIRPFGFTAEMRRAVRMAQDDDEEWLARTIKSAAELPVARGLLVQIGTGGTPGDTWIGNPQATEIPSPTLTDATAVATAVAAARSAFFSKTIGIQPILHVNPGAAIVLKKAGVLELDPVNGEDRTAWGDSVVISEGYSDIPNLSPVPLAFFTGPLSITLSEVYKEDVVNAVRQNRKMYQATMLAAIDTLPCAIVRIGPVPTAAP